jgi:twinkle protein
MLTALQNNSMKVHNDSKFVAHTHCEVCDSKDNAAIFDDGHTYCFGCEAYTPPTEGDLAAQTKTTQPNKKLLNKDLLEGEYKALKARGISEATCRKFDYTIGQYKGRPVQIANFRNEHGEVVAQKIRDAEKNFTILGEAKKMGLFGQHLWATGQKLVITEGEIDCLSVSQVQRNQYPTVSLPNGAQSGKKALMAAWDWLGGFDEIILMFDNDEAGQRSAIECAEALPVGKVKIAKLAYKDANEALLRGAEKEIITAIWRAKDWRPDGIISTSELRDSIAETDEESLIKYPYDKLNDITKGIRPSTLVTICAGSGVGKSTLITEFAYHLHIHGQKVGMLMLEEENKRTVRGLIGLHLQKNIVQDYLSATKEEVLEGHDSLFREQDVQLFNHFGSTSLDIVVNRIQYMTKAMGCSHIFLDHISILVSGVTGQVTDERRLIDQIMTTLRTMVQELRITLFLVSHLTRPQGDGHENGAKVKLSQLRGSHSIAQLADFCIGLQVNADDPSDDTRDLIVLKNRFTGQVGWAGKLKYHRDSGRLIDTAKDDTPF